jgi:hypothetical protein
LVFHWTPLSIGLEPKSTPGQAPKEASKQTGKIKKTTPVKADFTAAFRIR